jgi:membrane protein implicated in regulation of membrane protease activity
MRARRMEELYHSGEIPLVVRARFEKTFFGLGAFAGIVLLLGGTYLMIEALMNPLGASDVGVLTAGVALALSSFLLVYLVWPKRRRELSKQEHENPEAEIRKSSVLTVHEETVQNRTDAKQDSGTGKNLPSPM